MAKIRESILQQNSYFGFKKYDKQKGENMRLYSSYKPEDYILLYYLDYS